MFCHQVELEIPRHTRSLTGFVQREKFLGLEDLSADRPSLAGRRVQVVDAHAAGSRADGDLKSGDEFRFLPLFNVPRKNRAEFRINASIRGERPRHARSFDLPNPRYRGGGRRRRNSQPLHPSRPSRKSPPIRAPAPVVPIGHSVSVS